MQELNFVPYQGNFADFIIISRNSPLNKIQFEELGANIIQRTNYNAYVWGDNLGERFLTGLGVLDDDFVVGPRRLDHMPARLGAGSYALVDISGPTAMVRPDPFGMHVIYAGRGIITNRLHLAALALRELDLAASLTTTYNEGVFSFSFNTFSTPIQGVSMLAVGDRAYLDETIRIIPDEVSSDFEEKSPDEYWDLIQLGAAEIVSNVNSILDSGLPITCDITGGRDSRIVFGALIASGRINEVTFNTNTRSAARRRDLEIGTGLVKMFGGDYGRQASPVGYAVNTVEQTLQRRRSQLYGAYHFITEGALRPISSLGQGHSIRMLGGGGELYRNYYQDLFTSVKHDEQANSTLVERMLRSHHGNVFGDKFLDLYLEKFDDTFRRLPGFNIGHKLDAHYLNFRNRFHFGIRQTTASSMHAVNPATSKYLLRAARSLPSQEKATERVLFDTIRALDERLAYLPFDKPIDPRIFKSPYHRDSVFDNATLSLEPAIELAKKRSPVPNPCRPRPPQPPPYDFKAVLDAEIAESMGTLGNPESSFAIIMNPSLDKFITYAQKKSPRHHSALASRLRAFADYATMSR